MCSDRRAHVLVWKGKAEVSRATRSPLRSAESSFVRPHVIRLLQYVRVPRAIKRRISRRALFARDGWKCVYCGTAGGRLTLDHVVPRSRGRRFRLGERRHGLRALQSAQGRPAARGGGDVAPSSAARAGAGAVHPARDRNGCRRAGASTCRRSSSSSRGCLRAVPFNSAAARGRAVLAVGAVGAEDAEMRGQVAQLAAAWPRSRDRAGGRSRTASKR